MAEKTHAEIMLEKIRAVLEGRITADLQEYQIAGRAITKIPFQELMQAESRYSAMCESEKAAQDIADGLRTNPNKIKVRIVNP